MEGYRRKSGRDDVRREAREVQNRVRRKDRMRRKASAKKQVEIGEKNTYRYRGD